MKKIALLLTGILFFAALPLYAQITLQVDWVPVIVKVSVLDRLFGDEKLFGGNEYRDDILAKNVPMGVYVDGSEVFTLRWKESKQITLPSGNHTIYVRMKGGSFTQPDPILSFNANSGRVVFRATPISGLSANSIELTQISPSSQPQSVAQQPQTNNNQPKINSNTGSNALSNTTWYWGGREGYRRPETLYFGNNNYRLDSPDQTQNEEGSFTVSGDTVTLTSSKGSTMSGTIIGNSLKIHGGTFTRRQ